MARPAALFRHVSYDTKLVQQFKRCWMSSRGAGIFLQLVILIEDGYRNTLASQRVRAHQTDWTTTRNQNTVAISQELLPL